MAGDRRRASHSIDVPQSIPMQNSRKRRPSYSQDDAVDSSQFRLDDMDECNAALVLMKLSCSPHSPLPVAWNRNLGSSPGSSNQSWSTSSGSSSPPHMDDFSMQAILTEAARTRSVSTSDEGIVMDYSDEGPRKKKAHFQCTWKGCHQNEKTVQKIELHVRKAHLGPKKPRRSFDDDAGTFSDSSDHEEEFYYTEVEDDENGPTPPSPPTLSHRDMARPPHEDPDFQLKIVGNFRQGLALAQNNNGTTKHSPSMNAGPITIPTSPMSTHQKYSWSPQGPSSPLKLQRHSPRPSTSSAPYPSPTYIHHQHHYNSPNGVHHNNHHNHHHQSAQQQQQQQQQQQKQQHHAHLQQHPQSVPTITSNSVHHSPTSGPSSSIASLSHSAPAGSPLSLAAHTSTMHLTPHHHHHHHHSIQQQHHQQIHHHHQSPPQHHHQQQQPQQQSPPPQPPAPQQQQVVGSSTNGHQQSSPRGRTRGENKKCRKVYGMDHKDQWCTQCKWKKACSRFGD